MATIRYSASAENDLLEAWLFIAADSIEAADQMLNRIEADARKLLPQPKMGRVRDELGGRFAQLADVNTLHPVLFHRCEQHHDCASATPCARCADGRALAGVLKSRR